MRTIKLIFALMYTFIASGLTAQSDDFRRAAPAPGPPPEIRFGEYEEFTLDNGLKVVVVENHKLPRLAFNLLVDVPPIREGAFAGAAGMAGGEDARERVEIVHHWFCAMK